MARSVERRRANTTALPQWILPQLTQLVDAAPDGDQWLHEIKYDGYARVSTCRQTLDAQLEQLRGASLNESFR